MENEVRVEFLNECTATITLDSPVLFELLKETALDAKTTVGQTFKGMLYDFVNSGYEAYVENPNDQRFRTQTDEEWEEDRRNSAKSPEDFEKFAEQFLSEHKTDFDPANRQSILESMRAVNEMALESKARYESIVNRVGKLDLPMQ